VLKIVDFGVSEMFEKNSEMNTSKSAGSPAFMPPELCVAKHGEVSGRAVDIWSTGVTLYCLAFGRIPFEKASILDLYEAIKNDEVQFPEDCNPELKDLLVRLLDKDPTKRIELDEVRDHPWVTRNGADMLLSKDENIVSLVDFPTQEEVNKAITAPILKMVTVVCILQDMTILNIDVCLDESCK
jgi:calcium/calmodulin-dependent protein kinase kinase 2